MKHKECEIIRDLLPSYVDEICSEASKEWVEQHLAECAECSSIAERMKHTELSVNKLETEGLEAVKKLRRKQKRQSLTGYGMCLALILFMLVVFVYDNFQMPLWVLYLMLPVSMLVTRHIMKLQENARSKDGWDVFCLIGTLTATGYGVFMMFYGFDCIVTRGKLFSLPAMEVGPFLYRQMVLSAVLSFGIYLVQLVRSLKKGYTNTVITDFSLVGIFLMMAYCVHMGYLSDIESALSSLREATFFTLSIGLIGTAVGAMLDKFRR